MSISYDEFTKKLPDMKNLLSILEGDEMLTKVVELGILKLKQDITKFTVLEPIHKTTKIKCPYYNDYYIDIDNGIIDLIEEIWKAGIKTSNSCEDISGTNYMWVEFCPASDADSFMEIIINGQSKTDKLSLRALNKSEKNNWIIEYTPENINETVSDPDTLDIVDFISNISIKFHKSDYKHILKRLKAHNIKTVKTKTKKSSRKSK